MKTRSLLPIAVIGLSMFASSTFAQQATVHTDEQNNRTVLKIPGKGDVYINDPVDYPTIMFQFQQYGVGVYVVNGSHGTSCEDNIYVVKAGTSQYNVSRVEGCYFPSYSFAIDDGQKAVLTFKGPSGAPKVFNVDLIE